MAAVVVAMITMVTPTPASQLSVISVQLVPSSSPTITYLLGKLDRVLQQRVQQLTGRSRVIVRAVNAESVSTVRQLAQYLGGTPGRPLPIIQAQVVELSNLSILFLAASSLVERISLDREIYATNERTRATIGAASLASDFGYDGDGITVAVMDSGVTRWHDDLAEPTSATTQRTHFIDLISGRLDSYDDYGHGTHVAGIIAGNGYDSSGARTGVAPASRVLMLKVLDAAGRGRISDVIAGFDYLLAYRTQLNIRVVNLSLAAPIHESYKTDPLTLAARRVVDQGVVVVAAAGNSGRNGQGETQYGGVTAPGNAPWVLTVGASSHAGTTDRADDAMAGFSSRGPSAVDFAAKPDLVAPGVGTESLSDPESSFYVSRAAFLLSGTEPTAYLPYLSLSGTSMAAPVVSGTIALMLQANPSLTPNAVKAILQYTAQPYQHDALTQGTGFLDARAAIQLARYFAAPAENPYPDSPRMARQLIWGNQRVGGGVLTPDANAWAPGVRWGSTAGPTAEPLAWGAICSGASCHQPESWQRWGPDCLDAECRTVSWGPGAAENVVWGSSCGGSDCGLTTWTISNAGIVGDAVSDETVVWGTIDDETVVWGTMGDETVVWGTMGDETVVWGTTGDDTVVWGTTGDDTVVWGTTGDETVVWGTTCDASGCYSTW